MMRIPSPSAIRSRIARSILGWLIAGVGLLIGPETGVIRYPQCAIGRSINPEILFGTDDVPSAVAGKLSWLMESWSSIELRLRVDSTNHDEGRHGQGNYSYIETALGQRLFERSWPGAEPGETDRKVEYADGKRFAESSWADGRQENVIYTSSFANEDTTAHGHRPTPVTFLYLQHEPLAKALPKAEYLGRERRLGRECEVLLVKDVKWSYYPVDIVYHLDRETALPLKVRCFDAVTDRAPNALQWSWEAKSFDRLESGQHWPLRSADVSYRLAEGGGIKILSSREIQVETIHFNKEYPESIFRPIEEPGTHVLDRVQKKQYVVPGASKAIEDTTETSAPPPAPIQATPPPDWTSTASTVGLILGLALIAVGALAWWRRH